MKFTQSFLLAVTSISLVSGSAISKANKAETTRFYEGSCTSKNIRIRKEWRNLTSKEKKAYLKAEKCLIALPSQTGIQGTTTRFSDLQGLHRLLTNFTVEGKFVQDVIHNVGQFLPWHRIFMYAHETMLRNECDYAGPMPWWDEAADADAGNWFGSNMWASDAFGGNGTGSDNCVQDGAFAGLMEKMGPGLADTTYCLSRNWDDSWAQYCGTDSVKTCAKHNDYYSFWVCVAGHPGLHYAGHTSLGGVMSDITSSPGEPVFFLHHNYVDRVWWQWQQANSSRLTDMSGNAWNSTYFSEYNITTPSGQADNTTMDYILHTANILPDTTIANVMNIQGGYLCYDYDY